MPLEFRAFVAGKMFSVAEILFTTDRIHLGEDGRFGMPLSKTIVMQYTGLKDKYGRKIFVGDITQGNKDSIKLVVRFGWYSVGSYEDYEGGYSLYLEYNGKPYTGIYNKTQMEIIGNIYENPELIK